ncbi:beta-hexosaminidase subunit alpha-like [Bacillus rossius redtenbacheri]|uniref:beta-hexosaminidase subunit alpha-like n=1 Tax=Bacillus rossius redtenbacheri TaxID=93214 RepID=UPI002FDCE4CE
MGRPEGAMAGAARWAVLLFGIHLVGAVDTFGPLVRASEGEVWPKPQKEIKHDTYTVVRPSNFTFKVSQSTCSLLEAAVKRYEGYLARHVSHHASKSRGSHVGLDKESDPRYVGYLGYLDVRLNGSCEEYPHLRMLESYELIVNSTGKTGSAALSSSTIWGILRGLETFSQLLYIGGNGTELIVNSTRVIDEPRFTHRGLMLDTSRHFLPTATIRTVLDGMEMNKMNVFHWHIVDSQSFPYQSEAFPNLSKKGAYDQELIYTQEDVKNVIEYARVRGIRVVPEFDTPGHTLSWGPGEPDLLTPCYSFGELDGTYGPINPTLDSTYAFVRKLFREVAELFPDEYMHLGGDEVDFSCWRSNPSITSFMSENGIEGYAELEQYYMQRVVNITGDLNASSVVWQEVFDNGVDLPAGTVVHVWTGSQAEELRKVTAAGHPALLSACWYLGRLESGGDWKKFYECEPTDFSGTVDQKRLVMGGEACMWGEVVDESNVVSRVWPRASATAEKLWSSADADSEDGVARRLEEHYCRMKRRGVGAQPPNGPGYCR